MKRIFFLLLSVFFTTISAYSALERNYIYLFDCSKSMIGYNGAPNVWEDAKKYLQSDIERYSSGTSIHVIPFQHMPLSIHSFLREDFNWRNIEKDMDGYVQNVTRTNICDALDTAEKYIDFNKDNYIYLLTDGLDNVRGMSVLAQKLRNLCGKYKNTRLYYVVLTANAIDPTIRDVVDACSTEFFVDVTKKLNPFGSFNQDAVIYANTLQLEDMYKLQFSAVGKFPVTVSCSDPNFSVLIKDGHINDGVMSVKISPKKDIKEINENLPESYEFTFDVQSSVIDIINPTINVIITNKVERDLTLLGEEVYIGTAEWYDAFPFKNFSLWGEKKDKDVLKVDLKANFNEEAKKDGSVVTLKFTNKEKLKDYQIYFNGVPVEAGTVTLDSRKYEGKAELNIVFEKGAQEGKRYFEIEVVNCKNLETINGAPIEIYNENPGSLRAKYNEVWNPLKTILMWVGILFLVGLILWFGILKYAFYPYIKIGSIMVKSPYYSRFKIKGARRVIFSNKLVKQSVINKLFTGKVVCHVNPCWSQPLVLEPAKNKSLKIVEGRQTYTFSPYDSRLKVNTNYEIQNTEQGEKIEILINQ